MRTLSLFLFSGALLCAQDIPGGQTLVPGPPPGGSGAACTDQKTAYLDVTGIIYTCQSSIWKSVGGSGSISGLTTNKVSKAASSTSIQDSGITDDATTISATEAFSLLSASHTMPFKTGAAASKPATCTVGEAYFANDASAGQNLYFCTTTNTWSQMTGGGGTPAGSSGDIQKNNGGSFGPAALNDNGMAITASEVIGAVPGLTVGSSPPGITAGTGFVIAAVEGTAPSAGCAMAGVDCIWADSTQHGIVSNFNNTGALPLVQGPSSANNGNLPSFNGTDGSLLQDSGVATANVVVNNAANTYSGGGLQDLSLVKLKPPITVVGSLPSAASNTSIVYEVTDGTTGSDCTAGSGTTRVWCVSTGSAWTAIGGGGGGGGASDPVVHTQSFSATPTFTGTSATTGTIDVFQATSHAPIVMTANVTSCSTSTFTPGQYIIMLYKQDGTGGRTWTCTGFDAFTPHPAPNAVTKVVWYYDGANFRLAAPPVSDAGYSAVSAIAAPSAPLAGGFVWYDSTALTLEAQSTAGVTTRMVRVFSGTASLGTSLINAGACATVVAVSATGVLTTDVIEWSPNTDPTVITGYAPTSSGSLKIWAYPTADTANFKICNDTSGGITPSALTLNWRVFR